MANDVDVVPRFERPARFWDLLDWPEGWFGGRRPWFGTEDLLRIEEEQTDDSIVIRAELPGLDPDKDVEITLNDGVLRIHAERRSEKKEEKEGRVRSEFRYGSFERAVRVPKDVDVDDVKASYTDGILEVRLPYKVPTEAQPTRVPVSRS